MRHLAVRVGVALALTVLSDLLLFGTSPGVGLTIFALLVAGVVAWQHRREMARAQLWSPLWLVLALAASLQTSTIGRLLLIVLGWSILAMVLIPEGRSLFQGFLRGLPGGIRSYTAAPADVRRYAMVVRQRARGIAAPAWVFILPAVLVLVFAILIIPANLMLSRWSIKALDSVMTWLGELDIGRVFFWLLIVLGVYGLLRFRLGRRRPARTEAPPLPEERLRNELKACTLTFIGLNVLYLAANVTDLAYLWLAMKLPEGVTYSQFAHQGSYRLILAVVLAAVTLAAFVRSGTLQERDRRSRVLVYIFIVQNLIVLVGAARRLELYVEVFGFTRFRLATLLWLLLVFVGFVLIFVKVWKNRPFRFLLESNAISTAVLLSAVAILNLDSFIANWNVTRYEKGDHTAVDIEYLGELDEGGMGALGRLLKVADRQTAGDARAMLEKRLEEEEAICRDWRAWTWTRAAAIAEAERALK